MKRLLPLLLALLLALPAVAPAEEEKVLNILTWAEYINGPAVLEPFTAETGIKIDYSYFDSNEEMLMKLQAVDGGTYDVVLASDYILDITRREGLMMELDRAKIPNWDNIGTEFRGQFFDPDDKFVVPYIAGSPLIIYDPALVDIEVTGYNSLWDESLQDSIVLIDDARNIIGMTLKSMGYGLNETDPEILAQAESKLMDLKANVRVLDYNRPDTAMASGEAIIGYMFTPGIVWAQQERPDLVTVYPEEGMGFGIDALFIPKNAPHPDNAHAFLDFLLRPEIGVEIIGNEPYICVNEAAYAQLPDSYFENPALNIPVEVLGEKEFIQDVGDAETIYSDIWTRFKQY